MKNRDNRTLGEIIWTKSPPVAGQNPEILGVCERRKAARESRTATTNASPQFNYCGEAYQTA